MVEHHLETGAGVTVAAIPVPREQGREFGVIEADADGKILDFHEKADVAADDAGRRHAGPRFHGQLRVHHVDARRRRDALVVEPGGEGPRRRRDPRAHRQRASPTSTTSRPTSSPARRRTSGATGATSGRSTRTTRPTWTCSAPLPSFNLYNPEWPVYSLQLPLPPAKLCYGSERRRGQRRQQPALHRLHRLGRHRSTARSSARTCASRPAPRSPSRSSCRASGSGPGARLHRCIVDKNVHVPAGYRLGVDGGVDPSQFARSDQGDHRDRQGPRPRLIGARRRPCWAVDGPVRPACGGGDSPTVARVPAWWSLSRRSVTISSASQIRSLARRSAEEAMVQVLVVDDQPPFPRRCTRRPEPDLGVRAGRRGRIG